VTLSFVLILLPLLVLAWQAWQSLNALSAQAAHINRTTLVDARRSEAMINAALEMERSYRQYCVLDDPTLARSIKSAAALQRDAGRARRRAAGRKALAGAASGSQRSGAAAV
jgi:predicted negative regulator of RcsB-dependent stress response